VAYCRWSSANWRCDVYCYASVSGFWVTHVANNRVDITRPLCPYPQVATYKGTGSTNDAANFVCK